MLEKTILPETTLVRKISNYGSKAQYSINGDFALDAGACTWLDVIGRDVYFAKDGCIFVQKVTTKGEVQDAELLQDLNDLSFTKEEAPYAGVHRKHQI